MGEVIVIALGKGGVRKNNNLILIWYVTAHGKTMMVRRIPSILLDLTFEEALEVTLVKYQKLEGDTKQETFDEIKIRVNKARKIQQEHLIKTVEYYLYSRKLENEFVRIDVIKIYLYNHKYKVNHIKQII